MLKNKFSNKGFTLVELMIATTVFSVIMMISMYTFMQINRLYTKGISVVRTQDIVRNVTMDIATQLQMTTGSVVITLPAENPPITGSSGSVCIGNKKYTYQLNRPAGADIPPGGVGTYYALKSEDVSTDCTPIAGTDKVLVAKDTRVLKFEVVEAPANSKLYNISITLMHAPNDGGGGPGTDLVQTANPPNDSVMSLWRCKSGVKGSEYCSLTNISTTVFRRIK